MYSDVVFIFLRGVQFPPSSTSVMSQEDRILLFLDGVDGVADAAETGK